MWPVILPDEGWSLFRALSYILIRLMRVPPCSTPQSINKPLKYGAFRSLYRSSILSSPVIAPDFISGEPVGFETSEKSARISSAQGSIST